MGATLSAYSAALKEIWTQDHLEEQIYQDNPFLSKVETTQRFTIGDHASTPLHTGRNGGYTVLPAGGGNLNTAGNQQSAKATWNFTHHHQQVLIQGDVIDSTDSSAVAVANVVDTEVSGAVNDMRKQLTRQLFGNGDSLITACGTTTGSNVVVLSTTDGYDALVRGWLFPGLPVDIGTSGSQTSLINGEAISAVSVNATTPTITVTTSITTTSANSVSVKGARSGTTAYESNGLRNVVSTSATLGNVTVASQPTWQAAEVTTTSQALTLDLMLAKQQAVMQQTGQPVDYVLTGYKQQRAFYNLLQQQTRFAGDGNLGAGNVGGIQWNGMNIEAQNDCPSGDMYFLSTKHLFVVAKSKPYWQNQITGGDTLAWIQGTDSYGAKLSYRINLATNRRNAHARLGGLT